MSQPYFDNKGQLDRIAAYCIPGEAIYAVFDCKGKGTGFVGITDRRVIFYDQGVFSNKKINDLNSIQSGNWHIISRFRHDFPDQ
jgi:hypothetical protein